MLIFLFVSDYVPVRPNFSSGYKYTVLLNRWHESLFTAESLGKSSMVLKKRNTDWNHCYLLSATHHWFRAGSLSVDRATETIGLSRCLRQSSRRESTALRYDDTSAFSQQSEWCDYDQMSTLALIILLLSTPVKAGDLNRINCFSFLSITLSSKQPHIQDTRINLWGEET